MGSDLVSIPTPRLKRALFAVGDVAATILRLDDGLRKVEQELVQKLSADWEGRFPDALAAAIEALESGDLDATVAAGDLDALLEAIRPKLVEGWADAIEAPVTSAVEDSYTIGREHVLKPLQIDVDWNNTDKHAKAMLASDSMYWVGDDWDNNLGGQISSVIQKQVIDQGLSRRDAGAALEQLFGETFPERSRSYWNVVASAGVVRSRTFGNVESFDQAGVETYIVRAIIDGRTSQICRHLNGKVFRVDAARDLRDRFLAAKDPEDAKSIHPWPNPEKASQMDAAQLEAAGIVLPPYHGECRTQIVPDRFVGDSDEQ